MTRALLRSTALALPPHERAALAAELLGNFGDEQDVAAAWDAEIERRVSEIERGEVKTISAAQVMQRLFKQPGHQGLHRQQVTVDRRFARGTLA